MRVAQSGRSRVASRGRPRKLTEEAIADAVLVVLGRDGLDALSMASAAAELGVGVATLYGYVGTKDELADLAVDSVLGRVPVPDSSGTPEAQAEEVFQGLYDLLIGNPAVAQILSARTVMGPGTAHAMETMLGTLEQAGLSGRNQVGAYRTLLGYVLGSSLLFVSHARDRDAELRRREAQQSLDPDRYPSIRRAWAELVAPTRPEQFEAGLRDLLGRFGFQAV